jgi:hypothetical protein
MTFDRSGTADPQRRFLHLTLEAMQELDQVGARPGFAPCFRIWDYGPHQPYRSWLIQMPERNAPFEPAAIVLERAWDAAEDRERLARELRRRPRLQPTMCVREAELPTREFASLRTFASRIQFPLLELRNAHLSIQPAQYGIEGFRHDAVRLRSERVRLEWGGAPPIELKTVAAWATQVRNLCSGCFPDENISIQGAGPTGLCSLCRRTALSDVVGCPACGVAYHRECWYYVGKCAIYGCSSTGSP